MLVICLESIPYLPTAYFQRNQLGASAREIMYVHKESDFDLTE